MPKCYVKLTRRHGRQESEDLLELGGLEHVMRTRSGLRIARPCFSEHCGDFWKAKPWHRRTKVGRTKSMNQLSVVTRFRLVQQGTHLEQSGLRDSCDLGLLTLHTQRRNSFDTDHPNLLPSNSDVTIPIDQSESSADPVPHYRTLNLCRIPLLPMGRVKHTTGDRTTPGPLYQYSNTTSANGDYVLQGQKYLIKPFGGLGDFGGASVSYECLSSPEAREAASAAETLVALANHSRYDDPKLAPRSLIGSSSEKETVQDADTKQKTLADIGMHHEQDHADSVGSSSDCSAAQVSSGEESNDSSDVTNDIGASTAGGDSNSELLQFQKHVHSYAIDASGNKIHKCLVCAKVFTVMDAFRNHVITHFRQKNKCAVCSKQFSRSWLLKGHMRTHTGERPYSCAHPGCGKAFADKSNLRSHSLIHTTTGKSYICTKCDRRFAQKRYLHKHKLEVCKI